VQTSALILRCRLGPSQSRRAEPERGCCSNPAKAYGLTSGVDVTVEVLLSVAGSPTHAQALLDGSALIHSIPVLQNNLPKLSSGGVDRAKRRDRLRWATEV